MIETILATALPVLLKLLGMGLDAYGASETTKKAYFDFISAIQADSGSSETLRASALSQKARLKTQIGGPK